MIEKIIEISREAGEIIKEGFGKNVTFEFKSNMNDLVTEIDKAAEKKIIEFIHKEYPGHNIFAEESGKLDGNSEYTWVVDPLDGTVNFAHGLPLFSVSIGLMKNDEIIAGAVYDVMMDQMYTAEKGSGAFQNGKRIRVSDNNDLQKSMLVTGFPYDIKENPKNAIEKFNVFLVEARAVRRLGSAAIDCCYVASGVFDGFWEVSLNLWDMCAGQLLIEEAGGKVTNMSGGKVDYNSVELLATNGKVHEAMERVLSRN